jgi:alkylhydroperoxidase family enzyme
MSSDHTHVLWTPHRHGPCRSPGLLLLTAFLVGIPSARGGDDARAITSPLLLPGVDDAAAWKKLPRAETGTGQALPAWARALAPSLPHTTAAMLELDYRHRTHSALPPKLRAMLQWTAAHALSCGYAEANAAADLQRSGGTADELQALRKDGAGLPEAERAALAFARKTTIEPDAVTDKEVADLVRCYGEKQVVAMVLLVAYSTFQDRLLLALDLALEPGGPRPPPEVHFAPIPLGTRLAVPRSQPIGVPMYTPRAAPDQAGGRPDFESLRKLIEKQRSRRARIGLPSGEGNAVHWGAVCRTYQPELASAWAACQRSFGAEANQDPIFSTSVFWIVSYARQSFY